METVQVD